MSKSSVSGIYVIANIKNGNVYIGQAQDINHRWRKHTESLKRGDHRNLHLQSAWNKYGEKSFHFKILERCPVEQLDKREQHYLDIYIPKGICYNIAIDAVRGQRGRPRSEETKRKISQSNIGRKVSEETRRKIGIANTNPNDETRRKLTEAQKRRPPPSEETREKLREARKRQAPISQETRNKMSEAHKAENISEEQRLNHSNGLKKRWERERAKRTQDE